MTGPTPAQVAVADQLLAANQEVARRLDRDAPMAEVWPKLGPVTAPIVGGMWLDIGAEHTAGRPFTCEHIPAAIGVAWWFPWLPQRWLCEPCSWIAADERATEATCDSCGAELAPLAGRRWTIGIPSARAATASGPAVSPPVLLEIELCPTCHDRNRERR